MKLRILVSYWYFKSTNLRKMIAEFEEPPEVFADSGAFSAFNFNETLDVREYGEWLLKHRDLFTVYANLDDKKSIDNSLKNQAYLESLGLSPLPVFHAGEPWSVLEDMLRSYDYVALGGLAGASVTSTALFKWLVECFRRAKEHEVVYHGFGMTTWNWLKWLKWYSVDSSSWGSSFRYGSVVLFNPRTGKFQKMKLGDWKVCFENRELLREYGVDPKDIADRSRNKRATLCVLSAMSYQKAEQWIRKLNGEVERKSKQNGPGFKVYLADGSTTNLIDAGKGLKVYLAGTNLQGGQLLG